MKVNFETLKREEIKTITNDEIREEKRLLQTMEKAIDEIYYHNKNLTKKQYYAICDLKDILSALTPDEE